MLQATRTQKMASSDAHKTVKAAQLWVTAVSRSLWHYLWHNLRHYLWLYLWHYLGSVHCVCPLLF